jgi:hypothetical protein
MFLDNLLYHGFILPLFSVEETVLLSNARLHLLPEAGARHKRTLAAVRCKPWFGAGSGRDMAFSHSRML